MVILHWVLVFFFIFGVFLVFDPLGHHHNFITSSRSSTASSGQEIRHNAEIAFKRSRLWEWRCQMLCCSCCTGRNQVIAGVFICAYLTLSYSLVGGGKGRNGEEMSSNNPFSDVSEVLTFLFHDIDLVPTDIAAGLFLLHLRQKQKKGNEYRQQANSPTKRCKPSVITEAPASVLPAVNGVITSSPTLDCRRADFSPSALSVPPSAACSPDVVAGIPHHLCNIMYIFHPFPPQY